MNKTFYLVGKKTRFSFQQAENISREEAIKRAKEQGLGFIVQFTMLNGNPHPSILAWDVQVLNHFEVMERFKDNPEALSVLNNVRPHEVFIVSGSAEGEFAFPFQSNAHAFSRISA